MDARVPVGLAIAVVLAVFNARAQKSGVVATHIGGVRRSEMPRMFLAFLVMRWCAVAIFVGIALAVVAGVLPPV